MTAQTAQTLVNARNSISGQLRTILHTGTANVAPYTASARQALATADAAHETLTGSAPDDEEYVAMVALVESAERFVAACATAQAVLGGPTNWRAGTSIDAALKAVGR